MIEGIIAGLVAAAVVAFTLTMTFHLGRRDAGVDFLNYCHKPKAFDERCLAAMGYEMKEKP